MKILLTSSLLCLLALTVTAPAMAAGGGVGTGQDLGGDGYGLIGVIAPIDDAGQALGDLKADNDDQAILIGMLLPAIQKVREAASRSASACPSDPKVEDSVDFDCAASRLSEMILDSQTGRAGSPGLLNLYMKATGESLKQAKVSCRKTGGDGAAGTERMVIAILIGLTEELEAAKIGDGSVRDPLDAAIKIADQIDKSKTTAKPTDSGWDLVMGKKA